LAMKDKKKKEKKKRWKIRTINGEPVDINFLGLVGKIDGAITAVVHVHNAPLFVEPGAVFTPIARAAAIVDVQDGKASAGPILNGEVKGGGAGSGGTPVDLDQKRRALAVWVISMEQEEGARRLYSKS